MAAPKISIVISVLNGAATLSHCLESIFEQSYTGCEVVVMDGGSKDGTRQILERNAGRLRHWESEKDRGIYHAWNKALDHVTGEWICFLGADDRFHDQDSLMLMTRQLATVEGRYRVVYASVDVVDREGEVLATVGRPWCEARPDFLERMAIPHQATFHHRTLFARHGRFDESYRICGDYELLLRELLTCDAHFVPGLVVVTMGAGGLSDDPASAVTVTREFVRARRAHGLSRVPEWLSRRLWRARCRAWLTRRWGSGAADSVANVYRFLVGKPRL